MDVLLAAAFTFMPNLKVAVFDVEFEPVLLNVKRNVMLLLAVGSGVFHDPVTLPDNVPTLNSVMSIGPLLSAFTSTLTVTPRQLLAHVTETVWVVVVLRLPKRAALFPSDVVTAPVLAAMVKELSDVPLTILPRFGGVPENVTVSVTAKAVPGMTRHAATAR